MSGTSALCETLEAAATVIGSSREVQSDLAASPANAGRYTSAMRGLVEGWHADRTEDVVIDKGRGWIAYRLLLDVVMPGSVSVFVTRDPRDVMASIERQHRRTAQFQGPGPSLVERCTAMLGPTGMVGGPMRFAEDVIHRNLASVEFVRYENMIRDPLSVFARLESRLDLDAHGELGGFGWDFENVVNVAPDVDGVNFLKFPHEGSGPIKSTGTTWHDVLSDEVGARIAASYPLYMQTFGYA